MPKREPPTVPLVKRSTLRALIGIKLDGKINEVCIGAKTLVAKVEKSQRLNMLAQGALLARRDGFQKEIEVGASSDDRTLHWSAKGSDLVLLNQTSNRGKPTYKTFEHGHF